MTPQLIEAEPQEAVLPAWLAPPLPPMKINSIFTSPLLELDNKESIERRLEQVDGSKALKTRLRDWMRVHAVNEPVTFAEIVSGVSARRTSVSSLLLSFVQAERVELSTAPTGQARLYRWIAGLEG